MLRGSAWGFVLSVSFASIWSASATVEWCADENGSCTVSMTPGCHYNVIYMSKNAGDAGRFGDTRAHKDQLTGKIPCNNDFFGDPEPGVFKACYVVRPPGDCGDKPVPDTSGSPVVYNPGGSGSSGNNDGSPATPSTYRPGRPFDDENRNTACMFVGEYLKNPNAISDQTQLGATFSALVRQCSGL